MKFLLFFFCSTFLYNANASYENINTYSDHIKEMKTTVINGNTLAYIDEGEGEPIVLMHGIPTNSWMFRKIIPGLVKKGYRVIAPDLLGMGQSEKVKDEKKLSIYNQAEVILTLLSDKLKLDNWKHLVHDFGGPITWAMMKDSRFQINELIVLDTFLFKSGFSPGLNIFTRGATSLMTTKLMVKPFFTIAIKSMVQDKGIATKKMIEGYVMPLKEGGANTYRCLYFSVNDIIENLDMLQNNAYSFKSVPTKIIWGKNDKFLDSEIQLNQIQEFFNTNEEDILVLENAKHIITEEFPEEILNKL